MAHRRIELLQNFGVDITYEEVALDKDGNPRTQIRRPHFTDVLLKKAISKTPKKHTKSFSPAAASPLSKTAPPPPRRL